MEFLQITKGISVGMAEDLVKTLYSTRARRPARALRSRGPRETKGFLVSRATELALATVYKRSFIDGM